MQLSCVKSETNLQWPHQNIVRFEITEDDALPVKIRQTCCNLIGYFESQHVTKRHVAGTCKDDTEAVVDWHWSRAELWNDVTCLCFYASPPEQSWGSPGGLTEGRNRAGGYWCPPDRRCRDVAESATYRPPGGTQWSFDTHLQTAGVSPWCLSINKNVKIERSVTNKEVWHIVLFCFFKYTSTSESYKC